MADDRGRYSILWPGRGGPVDWLRFLRRTQVPAFVESSVEAGPVREDHRWVIFVSIVARRLIALLSKPLHLLGIFIEFLLNLISQNEGFLGLLANLFKGSVRIPIRDTVSFVSATGEVDRRIDLFQGETLGQSIGDSSRGGIQIDSKPVMDLCIMASKLAYENEHVVEQVINHRWKMHFVDFYNGWNEFQKERSTQVFILCDKAQDANLVLISFRGTEPFDADDWITDFDYSWYEIPEMGKIHMGFLEALGLGNRVDVSSFENVLLRDTLNTPENLALISKDGSMPSKEDEVSAYYAVRLRLMALLAEHKNAVFLVTGHSLGGALAILFPTILLLHREYRIMERLLGVCTFGQPRVGDQRLGEYMKVHLNGPIPKYIRVVYCNDLVPRLPYDDKTFLYKHFGRCLYYNSLFIEKDVDEEPNRNFFGIRYLVPTYLNAIWELGRSLVMGYMYGPEYSEGWFSILLRIWGLLLPGISAHSPTNYINSIRIARKKTQMTSF